MAVELSDDLIALEAKAWQEIQAGQLTVEAAAEVQAAVTAHADATGLDRYTVEVALRKTGRHAEG